MRRPSALFILERAFFGGVASERGLESCLYWCLRGFLFVLLPVRRIATCIVFCVGAAGG